MSVYEINLMVFHFMFIQQVFLWNFAQQFNQNNQKVIDAISASIFFPFYIV